MKQNRLLIIMGIIASTAFTSCISNDLGLETGGSLNINLNPQNDFVQTRALSESSYRNTSNYRVKVVSTSNNNIMIDCLTSELGAQLPKTLPIGTYEVSAVYGNEHAASRDEFMMKGSSIVTVKGNGTHSVTIDCKPTCGKVSVEFDPSMTTYFSDYSVEFGGTRLLNGSTFVWSKTDSEPWYVGLDSNGESISYTITLKASDEYVFDDGSAGGDTKMITGSFNLERNCAHKLTVKASYNPGSDGSLGITITVDESTNDTPIDITIPVSWT